MQALQGQAAGQGEAGIFFTLHFVTAKKALLSQGETAPLDTP